MKNICFIDLEISSTEKVQDVGLIDYNNFSYHEKSIKNIEKILKDSFYICGHNIFAHDSKYIERKYLPDKFYFIDTLLISPLVYPKKKHHNLLKDDKLSVTELNNPVNDAKKCRDLFFLEVDMFNSFDSTLRNIYCTLLSNVEEFKGFFEYVNCSKVFFIKNAISKILKDKICSNAELDTFIKNNPVELAYVMAIILKGDKDDSISPWVQFKFPMVNKILKKLRATKCKNGCSYCNEKFSAKKRLKEFFGYDDFRTYDGEPLQEKAVNAAIENKSLLAIFPTGGGKSITFQLPALIAGDTEKGLTIVISPLQSLMKDQVDGLKNKGIIDAVTINGLLDPIERSNAIELIENGIASILYIAPESLRSKTIERVLSKRNIVRIVIDEAHCFSTWGQDFRVDYMYIATFIKRIQKEKELEQPIPVSCFTATAKQKVISDILDYFNDNLGLRLERYTTNSTRKNLHYKVELKNDAEKYSALRTLISNRKCPTIIYVSRTKQTIELAQKLNNDGFKALPFNGKMEKSEKVENQDKFLKNEVNIMVATSAFGMGVDKPDVKLVVHYDISDSIENYIQEAGRAGRDQSIEAECIVYFDEKDLDNHFALLTQSKLSLNDINQIWRGIKNLTNKRKTICCSALEIARSAGWNDEINDLETRVRSAIAVLESSGYVTRGLNSPRVFATSIEVNNVEVAREKMLKSKIFSSTEIDRAAVILGFLISRKKTFKILGNEAESRVDYIADRVGINKEEVIDLIDKMRSIKILSDQNDLVAYLKENENKAAKDLFNIYAKMENELVTYIKENYYYDLENFNLDLKDINEYMQNKKIKSTIKRLKDIIQI